MPSLKSSSSSWNWWVSKLPFGSSSVSPDIVLAQAEISALESFYDTLHSDLNELLLDRDAIEFSKTWKGKLLNLSGYGFSVICVFKVLSVISISLMSCLTRFLFTMKQ